MTRQRIRIGHSPDPDDAFMFYGLACAAVDEPGFSFEHMMRDIQTLNEWARAGLLEVTAVSVHAYAYVHEHYALLPSGASMGASGLADYFDEQNVNQGPADRDAATAQGPLLVCGHALDAAAAARLTIAVPGTMTTAFLALQLALGKVNYVVMPFDAILPAVAAGEVEAGLLIHEGQLTYARHGLHAVLDLGRWWYEQTQLPLPLGCNVVRRDLGRETMATLSRVLEASIDYGLAHRREALHYAERFGRGLDETLADNFVAKYVNQWTRNYGPRGREAITELLRRGAQAGMTPPVAQLDFV